MSDLHLEFGGYTGPIGTGRVLLLPGDIHVAAYLAAHKALLSGQKLSEETTREITKADPLTTYHAFLDLAMANYDHIVTVCGNHEHYHGTVDRTPFIMEEEIPEKYKDRYHMLEKEAVEIDGVVFYGATLWTDFNRDDPLTRLKAEQHMRDYEVIYIRDEYEIARLIRAPDVREDHTQALEALRIVKEKTGDKPMVVLSHHAPSQRSCHPRYSGSYTINGCYNSNLEHLFGDRIKLWVHGHTHDSYDYTINGTRVVCNPRGYVGHKLNDKFDGTKTVEI